LNYRIEITPHAARQLKRLARPIQAKLVARIEQLAHDPRPQGVVSLSGAKDLLRIRDGDYRIVYSVEDDVLLVIVVGVGNRKDIYQRLFGR